MPLFADCLPTVWRPFASLWPLADAFNHEPAGVSQSISRSSATVLVVPTAQKACAGRLRARRRHTVPIRGGPSHGPAWRGRGEACALGGKLRRGGPLTIGASNHGCVPAAAGARVHPARTGGISALENQRIAGMVRTYRYRRGRLVEAGRRDRLHKG